MFKRTTFDPYLPNGDPSVVPVSPGRAKTAALTGFPGPIVDFLAALVPLEGSIYYLSNAMGSEEMWGPNRNGDAFPADQLDHDGEEYGYRTFMSLARPFLGHRNSDPEKGFGDIPFAMYDRDMGRVYVIMRIDTNLPHFHELEAVVRAIERGDPVATSMGVRVPLDRCSICGNEAETRDQYCVHARRHMNETWPDGRRVYVRNVEPRFFDNSLLETRGADPAAFVLATVATGRRGAMGRKEAVFRDATRLSVDLARESYDLKKVARIVGGDEAGRGSSDKHSDIVKNLPADDREEAAGVLELYGPAISTLLPFLRSHEPRLDEKLLDELAGHDLQQVLSTLHFLGIDLRPDEFQRMVLVGSGQPDLARSLDKEGILFGQEAATLAPASCPAPSPPLIDWNLAEKLARDEPLMAGRSAHRPFLLTRVCKLAEQAEEGQLPVPSAPPALPRRSPIPALAALGGLYFALKRTALGRHRAFQEMGTEVLRRPWALPLIVLGSITVPRLYQDLFGPRVLPRVGQELGVPFAPVRTKQAGLLDRPLLRFGAGLPAAYMLAGHQDTHEYVYGKEPGPLGKLVQDHPAALGIGFGLFGGAATRSARRALGRITRGGGRTGSRKLSYLIESGACGYLPPDLVDGEILGSLGVVLKIAGPQGP